MKHVSLALGVLCVAALTGCAVETVWDRSLQPGPDRTSTSAGRAAVRTVPWERVEATLGELHEEVARSDVHPDEWNEERKAAARAKLLRGLQVSQDPSGVLILGHSRFRTTDDLTKAQSDLGRIAKDLGADMVVWSSRVLGKSETIVDRPVTRSTWGSGWRHGDDDDHRDFHAYTTSWVPVVVSMDEVGAVAYFLRVNQ